MSAQHCQGPWLAIGPRVYMAKKPGSLIATVGYLRDGRVEAANARLVAAAPDLLAALDILTDVLANQIEIAGHDAADDARIKLARAAIASATGEQQ